MTDREELFTPDELAVRLDEWANCLDKSQWDLRSDMRCAAIHLRRLASSDGRVKVRELEWSGDGIAQCVFGFYDVSGMGNGTYRVTKPNCYLMPTIFPDVDAAKAAAQADYEARIKSALVEVPAVKGEPEPVAWVVKLKYSEDHWSGEMFTDVLPPDISTYRIVRPLYAAPQADAGMREALAYAERLAVVLWSKHFKDSARNWKPLTGDLIGLLTQIDNMTAALTAPGATTKSDGGESFVTTNSDGSVTLDAYADKPRDELKTRCRELCSALNEWQFIAMEAATAHGNCLSNVPEYARTKIADMIEAYRDDDEPGPSDPSSTRSDVTVEELARSLRHLGKTSSSYDAEARSLLDQFEITKTKPAGYTQYTGYRP